MEEQKFLHELAELRERANMLTEDKGYVSYPIVLSDKDIYVNYKDWLQSKSHILIVTGIPGSGKSTLAKKLAEQFNVHYVELDVITFKIAKPGRVEQQTWEYVQSQDIMLYKYLKEKKLEPDFLAKQVQNWLPPDPIQFEETMLYMDWLINNQTERCVIDGACAAMFFEDHPEWQELPIIFKGTSVLKAIFRRLKRNVSKHGLFEGLVLWVSRVVTSVYSQYSRFAKEQDIGRKVVLPNQEYEWVSENYLFSQDNVESNVEKWINGEEPILYIIGLSGSGKTTLSNQMAEQYGCKVVHIDEVHHKLVQTHPQLIHGNPDKFRIILAQAQKELDNQRGIIEGELKAVFQEIQNKPIIVMGTSAATSSARMMKRTLGKYDEFKQWAEEEDKLPIIGPIAKMGSIMIKNPIKNFKHEDEYQAIREVLKKKSLKESAKSNIIKGPFYRVTYDNQGIYVPLKQKVGWDWKNIKQDPNINWLPQPKVKEYGKNMRSYFTQQGYDMFRTKTIPFMSKYLDKSKFQIKTYQSLNGNIVYRDKYQVVLDNPSFLDESYKMQFIFYHGSQEKYPELLPVSPNMGNKWEPPKWVTYMWKEKENAIKWGMQRAIAKKRRELGLMGKEGNTITWGEGPYTCLGALASEKDTIKKIAIGLPFYVYTIQIKPDTLGVGHATGLDEYTSTDPKPKVLKLEKMKITEKLIDEQMKFLTPEEFKKYTEVSLSATRGDLAGLMYDQEETFKRELFIKIKQRAGLLKPGDNLQVFVDQYMADKEKYTKLFSKFKSLKQLVTYIKSNVRNLTKQEDHDFVWPDELLTKKKGGCWDIAMCIWKYCTFISTYTNKISTRICRVGFSYRNPNSSSLSHQYHIVCMIKENDKWKVVNCTANEEHPDLKDPIYSCRYNKQSEVLKSFASKYIPLLYKFIQQEHPNAIMEKRIMQAVSNRLVQEFWVINSDKPSKGNKQQLISELFENT